MVGFNLIELVVARSTKYKQLLIFGCPAYYFANAVEWLMLFVDGMWL